MISPKPAITFRRAIAPRLALPLALALALALASAGASPAAVKYAPASYSTLLTQIDAHQVSRAVISNKAHTVKVKLTDGRREKVSFTAAQTAELRNKLKAAGSTVKFSRKKKKKSGGGHPLRYAAGGGLLLLVVVGGGFYAVARRRQVADPVRTGDPGTGSGASGSGEPPATR